MERVQLRLVLLLLLAGTLTAVATGASAPAQPAVVSASALGVSVTVPNQPGGAAAAATAPTGTDAAAAEGFAYPADGALVRTGPLSSSVSTRAAGDAQSVSDVLAVSILNGEITADAVAARATVTGSTVDTDGSAVTNLVVLGAAVPVTGGQRVALADWGYLVALEGSADAPVAERRRNARSVVTALRVVLTADHNGFPAGTEILIGRADAAASSAIEAPAVPPATTTAPAKTTPKPPAGAPPATPKPKPREADPRVVPGIGGPLFRPPPLQDISAPLSPRGYVFPVYGDASFGDTWGAPRATTGRHIGTDIFAALGAPILAVADGTVFSVGWNRVGGWRLWLRDRQGNQFYYAHLAAYTPLARNGAEVRAGQVLGFNGNSGDAQGTPFHLHFEVHPVGLLPLGYVGGAVNPYEYLLAWRRVKDVSFSVGRGWAPPVPSNATAPLPAAVLLGAKDISTASGLEPGSLERALAAPVGEGDGALLRAG